MRQVLVEVYKLPPVIDHEDLRKYLETIHTFPRYHLDFETYQEAIPPFDSCHPYEQIPFQYSLHIEYEDGHLEHREYLAKEGTDPRRAVAEHIRLIIAVCVSFVFCYVLIGIIYMLWFSVDLVGRINKPFPEKSR